MSGRKLSKEEEKQHDKLDAKMKEIENSIPILTTSELDKAPCACECGHDEGEIVLGYCRFGKMDHHGKEHIHVYYDKETKILKVVCAKCRFEHAGLVTWGRVLHRIRVKDGE